MYRTTYDLSKEEFEELRESYYDQLYESDEDVLLSEYYGCSCVVDVPDEAIHNHYDGVGFIEEDFWCNI